MSDNSLDRRDFLKTVSASGVTLGAATQAFAAKSIGKMSNRILGANDLGDGAERQELAVAVLQLQQRRIHASDVKIDDNAGPVGRARETCPLSPSPPRCAAVVPLCRDPNRTEPCPCPPPCS